MKSLKIAVVALAVSTSTAAMAAQENVNPFTNCGIGAALFPNHDVGATISNVIWDVGTTAVTSATASPETCTNGTKKDVAVFINDTYKQVEEDAVMGSGQHLSALMSIAGCGSASSSEMISTFQVNFGEALSAEAYADKSQVQKAEAMYNAFTSASADTGACVI